MNGHVSGGSLGRTHNGKRREAWGMLLKGNTKEEESPLPTPHTPFVPPHWRPGLAPLCVERGETGPDQSGVASESGMGTGGRAKVQDLVS